MLTPGNLIGKTIDQFRLDEFIGQGAMGVVYKAFDKVLLRSVALKLIPKGFGANTPSMVEARKRLIQEAQAAGCLAHPNIVTIHCYGENDEFQYICMEYIEGKTLGELLTEKKFLAVSEAVPIIEQVLFALEMSEKEGIVHRDIKPANIMIYPDERVKVMDFGIAKIPSLHLTTTGTVLGTPYYMSPEQITGQKVDIRSDIFSVGAVFYQIVTGVRPFDGETTVALAYKIVEVEPVPPRILKTNIPQAVEAIIKKALAKNSTQRYQTPREMLDDLAAAKGIEKAPPLKEDTTLKLKVSEPSPKPPTAEKAALPKTTAEVSPPEPEAPKNKREEAVPAEAPPFIDIPVEPKEAKTPPGPSKKPKGEGTAFKTIGVSLGLILVLAAGIFLVLRYIKTPGAAKPVTGPPPVVKKEEIAATRPSKKSEQTLDVLILKAKNEMKNNPANTQRTLGEVLSQDPNNFEANYQMGRLLTFQKEYLKAIPLYERARQVNGRVPEIPFNLGYIFMNQGNFDQAIKYYEICRSLSPSYQDEVLTNLGLCYLKKNEVKQAQAFLEEALKVNPNNSKAQALIKSIRG
jgi:eukaryotic-like serine/threonine-protein kinase